MQSQICLTMFRKWSEKLGTVFPLITLGYPKVRIACLNVAFSGIFDLEANLMEAEGEALKQKDKTREKKGKAKKK